MSGRSQDEPTPGTPGQTALDVLAATAAEAFTAPELRVLADRFEEAARRKERDAAYGEWGSPAKREATK